jgi:hypothetical protein
VKAAARFGSDGVGITRGNTMRHVLKVFVFLASLTLTDASARAQWTYNEGVNDGSDVKWATARTQSGSISVAFKCWTNRELHLLVMTTQPIGTRKVGEKASVKVRIDDEDVATPYSVETANLGGSLSYIRPRSDDLLARVRAAKTRIVIIIGTAVYVLDGKTSASAVDQMRARCKL